MTSQLVSNRGYERETVCSGCGAEVQFDINRGERGAYFYNGAQIEPPQDGRDIERVLPENCKGCPDCYLAMCLGVWNLS